MNIRLFHTRRRATLRRSIQLLLDVRKEQSDPDFFYSRLAKDTCELVTALHRDTHGCGLSGTQVLDVGGGPGYFAAEFAAQGADYIGLEPDVGGDVSSRDYGGQLGTRRWHGAPVSE